MPLYGRLYKYRQIHKSSLEDFITEAWVDLLNRIPSPRQLDFCRDFFFSGDNMTGNFDLWANEAAKLDGEFLWRTQVSAIITRNDKVTYRRPDIVLYKGKRPICVVENKIDAGFSAHVDVLDNGDDASLGQLRLYDTWLRQEGMSEAASAVVLITHLTQPPADYLEKLSGYHAQLRSVARWADFHKWLRKHLESDANFWSEVKPDTTLLLSEFLIFLKEMKMTTEEPTLSDFAAARLYLVGGAEYRIGAAMVTARTIASEVYKGDGAYSFSKQLKYEADDFNGLIFDKCEFPNYAWVQWGFWFGEGENAYWQNVEYDPPVIPQDCAFVWVYPNTLINRPQANIFPEWHFPLTEQDEEWSIPVFTPIQNLAIAEDGFMSAYSKWISKRLEEAKEIVALDQKQ